ncbi:MAG: hypothetical protein FWC41_10895 [Firmicutes bacterium]|nr:hypothetical protein [Bacillota bacterium]
MANYFPMSEDMQKLVDETLEKDNPYLARIGLDFVYLGVDKQSSIIQITKSSPLLNYIAKKEEMIFVIIYEEAFDRLELEQQKLIIANALNAIEFNSETGKTTINNKGCELNEGIYLKYREKVVLSIFAGHHAIKQIEEEKKEEKKTSKKSRKS